MILVMKRNPIYKRNYLLTFLETLYCFIRVSQIAYFYCSWWFLYVTECLKNVSYKKTACAKECAFIRAREDNRKHTATHGTNSRRIKSYSWVHSGREIIFWLWKKKAKNNIKCQKIILILWNLVNRKLYNSNSKHKTLNPRANTKHYSSNSTH